MHTEQIERISRMEQVLDASSEAISAFSAALEQYQTVLPQLQELAEYYSSPLWMADFEADEAGILPADLKRGVLSEDAVYNLLCSHRQLLEEIQTIIEKNRR